MRSQIYTADTSIMAYQYHIVIDLMHFYLMRNNLFAHFNKKGGNFQCEIEASCILGASLELLNAQGLNRVLTTVLYSESENYFSILNTNICHHQLSCSFIQTNTLM